MVTLLDNITNSSHTSHTSISLLMASPKRVFRPCTRRLPRRVKSATSKHHTPATNNFLRARLTFPFQPIPIVHHPAGLLLRPCTMEMPQFRRLMLSIRMFKMAPERLSRPEHHRYYFMSPSPPGPMSQCIERWTAVA